MLKSQTKEPLNLLTIELLATPMLDGNFFINFYDTRLKPGTFPGYFGKELDDMLTRIREYAYKECNSFKGNLTPKP